MLSGLQKKVTDALKDKSYVSLWSTAGFTSLAIRNNDLYEVRSRGIIQSLYNMTLVRFMQRQRQFKLIYSKNGQL